MSDLITPTKKALVAQVEISAGITIEGLLLPDSSFGISVTQANELLSFAGSPNHAPKAVKRMLGKDFQPSLVYSELNSNKVYFLTLPQFEELLKALVKKGNPKALGLVLDLMGQSLFQNFCDAFEIRHEKEERKQWMKNRVAGKVDRRTLTDAIQDYLFNNKVSNQHTRLTYIRATDTIYVRAFGKTSQQLKKELKVDNAREGLDSKQLRTVSRLEDYAARVIDVKGMNPVQAVNEAADFFLGPLDYNLQDLTN